MLEFFNFIFVVVNNETVVLLKMCCMVYIFENKLNHPTNFFSESSANICFKIFADGLRLVLFQ